MSVSSSDKLKEKMCSSQSDLIFLNCEEEVQIYLKKLKTLLFSLVFLWTYFRMKTGVISIHFIIFDSKA